MRYTSRGQTKESRLDAEYTYYSYKFLGVKPTSYAAFPINGAGTTTILRNLTLVADMCLVDLTSDAHILKSTSENLGNRKSFLFSQMPQPTPPEEDERQED